jgi:hypothetical protein
LRVVETHKCSRHTVLHTDSSALPDLTRGGGEFPARDV